MTDTRLDELRRMNICLKGLMDVRLALNSNSIVEVRARGGQAACLNVSVYPEFEQAFSEFISTQLCRLQQAFDEA